MSRRSPPQNKIISPLTVEDGFVLGWAWDPARPVLEVVLAVDGEETSSSHTGQPIADTYFALATPPSANCGFRLPLPRGAHDGRSHKLQVHVRDWQALATAPRASIEWFDGPCFGELRESASGHVSGWVAFRKALPANALPPVEVLEEGSADRRKGFDIALKADPATNMPGFALVARFRVERSRFAGMRAPVFSCLGRRLQREFFAAKRNIQGDVSELGPRGLHGWVVDLAHPLEQLDLVLVVDGLPVTQFRPFQRLPGLARQLKLLPEELGVCGFDLALPNVLRDGREHRVEVLCRVDGTALTKRALVYRHRQGGLGEVAGWSEKTLDSRMRGNDEGQPRVSGKPQVSVVILNRNGAPCLDDLFASFLQHNTAAVELIVIDHASTDASLERIRHWQRYLPIRLEALDRNDSFSASCNRGARLAKSGAVLFLNNDIVWLQDALPRMLETLQQRNVGAVGLRLLKAEFERGTRNLSDSTNRPQVQHLGVRFTLAGDQYLPYEVTPDDELLQAQYAPQRVGVVTGAVLLCRRKQFLDAGGFDEHYHYGVEDVELCLRLQAVGGLRTVCRNDLVALHHHGYTRLTDREAGMLDRQLLNQQRLSDKLGLWLKREYWRDLLAGERQLAGERLTIGLAVRTAEGSHTSNPELAAAHTLRALLLRHWPHCSVKLLAADAWWDYPEDCHVVVALNPHYDLRSLKHARRDLRTACFVTSAASVAVWQDNPSLHLYDRCLYRPDADVRHALALLEDSVKVEACTTAAPLGTLPDAGLLRVSVLVAETMSNARETEALVQGLRAQGALVDLGVRGAAGSRPNTLRAADVHITLFAPELVAADPAFVFRRKHDVIDILWVLGGAEGLRASDIASADEVWHSPGALPAGLRKAAQQAVALNPNRKNSLDGLAQQLRKLVDKKIGRSFYTS